jgi:Na+/H+-translocating membrane pyrophosphatase
MNIKLNKKTLLNQLPTVAMIVVFALSGSSNLHRVAVLSAVSVIAIIVMMPLAEASKVAAHSIKNRLHRAIACTAILAASVLVFLVALSAMVLALVDLIGSHTTAISIFGWTLAVLCIVSIILKVVEQYNNTPLRRHQKNAEALRDLSRTLTRLSAPR